METELQLETETICSNKCIENHLQQKTQISLWEKVVYRQQMHQCNRKAAWFFTALMMTKPTYELTVLHLCIVTNILLFQLQPKGTYKEK